MVFIGNPRSETGRGGGDRIVLRSKHSKLHLQHTGSILSIKNEVVEVGVVRGFIPNIVLFRGDFGDFGVSFVATVAGRYTRRGGPRRSVQGEPLLVLTRGP